MTVKEIYDDVLVEINKENAQSFTIEEFNYILNKSINTWVNERYGFYAADQQLTDDLRVLIKESVINVTEYDPDDNSNTPISPTFNATSSSIAKDVEVGETTIPVTSITDLMKGKDYKFSDVESAPIYQINEVTEVSSFEFTITLSTPLTEAIVAGNPILIKTDPVDVKEDFMNDRYIEAQLPTSDYLHPLSCKVVWASVRRAGGNVNLTFPAKRLTFDMYDFIQNNTYMRPHPNRPYYQVLDHVKNSGYWQKESDLSQKFQNQPMFKIFIGKKPDNLEVTKILIYHLKLPEKLTLFDDDIFTFDDDNSQIVEFPDYLKNEFVRRITMYLLEKEGNPRIQTQPQINQDIPPVPLNMQMAGSKQPTPSAGGQPQAAPSNAQG